jgi:hypothetical protein
LKVFGKAESQKQQIDFVVGDTLCSHRLHSVKMKSDKPSSIALLLLLYKAIYLTSPELCKGDTIGDSREIERSVTRASREFQGPLSPFKHDVTNSRRLPLKHLRTMGICFCCARTFARHHNRVTRDCRHAVTRLHFQPSSHPSPPLSSTYPLAWPSPKIVALIKSSDFLFAIDRSA